MASYLNRMKGQPTSPRLFDKISLSSRRLRLAFGLFAILLVLDGAAAFFYFGLDVPAGRLLKQAAAIPTKAAAWIPPANTPVTTRAVTPTSTAVPSATPGAVQPQGRMPDSKLLSFFESSPTPFQPATYTPTVTVTATPSATPLPSETPTALPSPTATIEPSLTPLPPLPDNGMVEGLFGRNQALPLSCESRSAADWAHFFGYEINELDFQNSLPKTDNPATGFVGNPRDNEGQIPPHSYGVYAEPVAQLLREKGVPARAYSGLGFDDIRREIAAGRPVIVWVVGAVEVGQAVDYTASDGQTVPVVRMEHTVMVAGYTPNAVYIQDGSYRYVVSIKRFRISWRALGNQAILAP